MFSLFDARVMRPLPVNHPRELVRIVQRRARLGTRSEFPYRWYEVLRDHATSFASVFAESGTDMDFRFAMTAPGPATQISISPVTAEFFEGLGARALYGRTLKREDARSGSDLPPAVLSYRFWKNRFRGDPRVVDGGTIDLQRHRFAIVGVMPREFNGWSVDTSPDVLNSLADVFAGHEFSSGSGGFRSGGPIEAWSDARAGRSGMPVFMARNHAAVLP